MDCMVAKLDSAKIKDASGHMASALSLSSRLDMSSTNVFLVTGSDIYVVCTMQLAKHGLT